MGELTELEAARQRISDLTINVSCVEKLLAQSEKRVAELTAALRGQTRDEASLHAAIPDRRCGCSPTVTQVECPYHGGSI